MKKLISFLFLFFCFPLFALANGTDKYYIEANILSNGDMQVKELKIMSGTYSGFETEIRYKADSFQNTYNDDVDVSNNKIYNGTGITDVKIYAVDYTTPSFDLINNGIRKELTQVTYASKGDYGVYTAYGNNYKIYQPSSYNQASLITYTIKDVVVLHNDVAEIAWDFIGKNYREVIKELIIVINLPGISNELRIFSHGPLTGTNEIVNKRQVMAKYTNVYPGQAIDARVVFDKNIVAGAKKRSGSPGLENILKFEEKRANKANLIREEAKRRVLYLQIIFYFDLVFVILASIYYFLKHDRERKSAFFGKYYREFIEDYNVEVIDYLFNKSITPNAMSASIMNLIYKKNISVEKVPVKKNKDIYVFAKLVESDNSSEKLLMNFLFNKVGNGEKFTDQDLKDYAKSTKTYEDFTGNYTAWKNAVMIEGESFNFWDNNSMKIIFSLIIILLTGGYFFIHSTFNIGVTLMTYILLGVNIFFLIYILSAKKRTEVGNEHYVRWKAFRNFLNDFGAFQEKDLPEIILWERYLVYATIFGLAHKVQKAMNVKIKEMQLQDSTTFGRYSMFDYMLINNIVNSSVSGAIRAASLTASQVAASSASSSGGFGGGSSFGGGGFGGGGSGGGRF